MFRNVQRSIFKVVSFLCSPHEVLPVESRTNSLFARLQGMLLTVAGGLSPPVKQRHSIPSPCMCLLQRCMWCYRMQSDHGWFIGDQACLTATISGGQRDKATCKKFCSARVQDQKGRRTSATLVITLHSDAAGPQHGLLGYFHVTDPLAGVAHHQRPLIWILHRRTYVRLSTGFPTHEPSHSHNEAKQIRQATLCLQISCRTFLTVQLPLVYEIGLAPVLMPAMLIASAHAQTGPSVTHAWVHPGQLV